MLAKRHSGIFKQIFARLQSHNCIFPNKWDEDQEAIRGRRQWPVDPRFGAFPTLTHEANPRSVRKEAAVPAASGKHRGRHFSKEILISVDSQGKEVTVELRLACGSPLMQLGPPESQV